MRTTTTITLAPYKASAVSNLLEKIDELLRGVKGENPYKFQDHIYSCMMDILKFNEIDFDNIIEFPDIHEHIYKDEFYRDYLNRLKNHLQVIEGKMKEIDEIGNKIQRLLRYLRLLSRLSEFDELNNQFQQLAQTILETLDKNKQHLLKLNASLGGEYNRISEILSDQDEKEDTITVKLFYKSHADKEKEMFSIPSEGHVALVIKSADGLQNHYISLYPDHNAQPITVPGMVSSLVTSQFRAPKTTVKVGSLVGSDSDNSGFNLQSSITLPCRDPLDFTKIAAWAHSLLTTYTKAAGAPKLPYQFYGQGGYSCSSLVLEGLRQANVEAVLPYQNNIFGIVNPKSVFDYASLLEVTLHTQKLEQQMREGVKYSQEQYLSAMLELTARKIQSYLYVFLINLDREKKLNTYDEAITYLIYVYKMLFDLSDRIKMGDPLDNINKVVRSFVKDSIKKLGNEAKLELDDVLTYLTSLQHFIEKSYILDKLNGHRFESTIVANIINNTEHLDKYLDVYHLFKGCLSNNDEVKGCNDLFNQNVFIQKTIIQVQELKKEALNSDHRNDDLIRFYNEIIVELKRMQGRNNQNIYFDQHKDITDNHNNHLLRLKNIISPHNQDMSDLGEYTENQIRLLAPASALAGNVELPSIFNLFRCGERWGMLENRAQNIAHQLVVSEKIGLNQKLSYIEQCIEDYKPSWWEFWRSDDERKRYDALEQKAKLLCILQSFNHGDLDVIDFTNKLSELAKTMATGQADEVKSIADGIFASFKENAKSDRTSISTDLLKKLLQGELKHKKDMMTRAFPKRPPCHNRRLSKPIIYCLIKHHNSKITLMM